MTTEKRNLREIYFREVIDLKTELEFRGIHVDRILEWPQGKLDYWRKKETQLRDVFDVDNYYRREEWDRKENKLSKREQPVQEPSNE